MSVRLPGCGSSHYCSSISARHGKDDVVVAGGVYSTNSVGPYDSVGGLVAGWLLC